MKKKPEKRAVRFVPVKKLLRVIFTPPAMNETELGDLHDRVEAVLKTLTYREREVIKLRYGLGDGHTYTYEEIARIFKITRERVRQIEAKAIRKLQQPVRTHYLAEFFNREEE